MTTARRRRPYAKRLPMAERREQVLDAALSLIATSGYRAVSMEAVAREIGVTRPVVYGAFPTLPVLLGALLLREEQRALRVLAAIVPREPGDRDPDDVLIEALRAFLDAVARHPDTWRLILLPIEGTPKIVRRQVERKRAALLEQLRVLVAWGLEHRGGMRELDEDLLTRGILSVGEEAGRLLLTDPERYSPERLTDFARRLLGALGAPAGG
jgi:AcrR family transcriptional regulator